MLVAAITGWLLAGATVAEARWRADITDITASQQHDGTTVVRVTADADFRSTSYSTYRLSQSPPRAVLRLVGIDSPYREQEIVVGDGNLIRITAGHNPYRDPPELSVVFELRSNDVRISDVGVDGDQLILQLSGGAAEAIPSSTRAGHDPASAASTATRADAPHTSPSLPPTPASTATPTPSPIPSPTPSPTAQPPTPPAPPSSRTSPPIADGVTRRRSLRTPSEPTTTTSTNRPTVLYRLDPPPGNPPSAMPEAVSSSEDSAIVEIVSSQRPDGATLLRITLDHPIGNRVIRYRRDGDDQTQFLLVVHGLAVGPTPVSIKASGPNLRSIDLTPLPQGAVAILQITFHLSSEDVSVQRAAVQGTHLVFVIAPANAP